MPKSAPTTRAGAGKPAKPSRAEKKAARAERSQQRRQTWRNLLQAFQMTRKTDKALVPLMVGVFVLAVVVLWALGSLLIGQPVWLSIPLGVVLGVAAAMLIFSRRAQSSAYAQAEGQPGAAAYVLDNLRGDWRVKQAVAGTTQLDAVHRLIGRPGNVLVGEGAPHRIRGLIAQEKRKLARVAGDTPIYDVIVGRADGEVPLQKLSGDVRTIMSSVTAGLALARTTLTVAKQTLSNGQAALSIAASTLAKST